MKNFWNERFSNKEYVYGTEPNQFYKESLLKLSPGKILFPAEGEGRNSTFAAEQGWDVYAFDSSNVAKEKAQKLYKSKNVIVNYSISTLESFSWKENFFDCIVLTFVHPQPDFRTKIHKNLIKYLSPKGFLILEGFSKKQINYNSGGPKNIELLFSIDEIENDFSSLDILSIHENEKIIKEGNVHNGMASVINLIAKKN